MVINIVEVFGVIVEVIIEKGYLVIYNDFEFI